MRLIFAFLLFVGASNAIAQEVFHNAPPPGEIYFTRLDGSAYRSFDEGATWELLQKGVADDRTSYFANQKAQAPIFYTTLFGIEYVSYDGARTFWNPKSAATKRQSAPIEQHDNQVKTSENFKSYPSPMEVVYLGPNPAKDNLTFKLRVRTSAYVRLSIEDIGGVERMLCIDRYLSAGDYQFQVDVSPLSSGLYNYRLKSSGLLSTGNVIILR